MGRSKAVGPKKLLRRCSAPFAIWCVWCALEINRLNAQTPTAGISVAYVSGRVEVSPAGQADWKPLTVGQVLKPGDRVRTGDHSQLTLMFPGNDPVRFRELSRFQIQASPAAKPKYRVNLLQGMLYLLHRGKPTDYDFSTPTASAAIRGTEFNLEVDPATGRTVLTMFDGTVELSNPQGLVTATSGHQAIAEAGQPPRASPMLEVSAAIQWCLYYPAILDPPELGLTPQEEQLLDASLSAYRQGDLLQAVANYPAGRQPAGVAETIYFAGLLLADGRVEQTESVLNGLGAAPAQPPQAAPVQSLIDALRQLITTARGKPWQRSQPPRSATEWMAESYYQQSRSHLPEALDAARQATAKAPQFGYAWERVAELEFSFGRITEAQPGLQRSLGLAPRNAQAHALAGFLLAARNKISQAIGAFDQAIELDGALVNAWLGRGLCRIRKGDLAGGRADLQIAAVMEPQRAVLRSYLAKAYGEEDDYKRADKEIQRAKELDPQDPTAWLYSALLNEQKNRINRAVQDLNTSTELNNNRQVYRSRLLLDQDRAVRNANLARLYADAGLEDIAVREASRAVAVDYANSAAHLFLANSYDVARQANPSDLRFESVALNEHLLASLMGPADGRLLAQPVSQQEYTRLFERDYFGLSTSTEYLSRGAWDQYGSLYGTFGNSSYAFESDYHWDPGDAPYHDLETKFFSAKFKQMITEHDGLFLQIFDVRQNSGDIAQRYDPNLALPDVRTSEKQEPTVLAGLDHQWDPANRTLLLGSRFSDSLTYLSAHGSTYLLQEIFGNPVGFLATDLTQAYKNRLTADSFELQHINVYSCLQTIAGVRFQDSTYRLSNVQTINVGNAAGNEIYFGQQGAVITNQSFRLHAQRVSPYLYEHWKVANSLTLIGGISYDDQEQPRNLTFAPISDAHQSKNRVSPKAALIWAPSSRFAARSAWSRSLAGEGLDQSVRLEPTQLAGFIQAYRGLIPASLGGTIDGSRLETADLSLEYRFPTRTYVALAGQLLRSEIEHDVGVFQRDLSTSAGPGIQTEENLRYQERSLEFTADQLLGDWFGVGLRYRASEARLKRRFPDLGPALFPTDGERSKGLLHTLSLDGLFRHPTGFFAGGQALWWAQELGDSLAGIPKDDFWQFNLFAGYRSPRRHVELTVGVLNLGGRDYRIHPINLYTELPRERTFFTRLQLNF